MSKSSRIVGFGDFLLRLSPPGYQRLVQASSFETYYTGAEANVCASLAVMGVDAAFVTRVPENPIADAGLGELRKLGVDVSSVVRGGDRLGVFYLEKGASQRPSLCVYDRMDSGVTTACRSDFDWPRILRGATHFHFTGITAGLGGELPRILEDACRAATRLGCEISCDLNYRSKLWSVADAAKTMPRLVKYVDHLIAGAWDAKNILGVKAVEGDAVETARRLIGKYPRLKTVASTFRTAPSASDNSWSAMLFKGGREYRSREYDLHLVDRVGGGDSFAAGLLFALARGLGPQATIDYATAASCLKHAIEKDVNLATSDEVVALATGETPVAPGGAPLTADFKKGK